MFWYRSDLTQIKRNLLSSITNLIYELPHDLPNKLRLRIFGNLREISILGGGMSTAQSPVQKLNFGNSNEKKKETTKKPQR